VQLIYVLPGNLPPIGICTIGKTFELQEYPKIPSTKMHFAHGNLSLGVNGSQTMYSGDNCPEYHGSDVDARKEMSYRAAKS
jgi:hypothetical protein